MPWTEEQKAALAAKRGKIASRWSDPQKRADFIGEQGRVEDAARTSTLGKMFGSGGQVSDATYQKMSDEAQAMQDDPQYELRPGQTSPNRYARGTSFVPRTGPAILHRGEAVIPRRAAAVMRRKKPSAFFGE